jgi:hypothetical protein
MRYFIFLLLFISKFALSGELSLSHYLSPEQNPIEKKKAVELVGMPCLPIDKINKGKRGAYLTNPIELANLDKKRKTLFVDLDNTIGTQNLDTKQWIIYKGAKEALKSLSKNYALVLLTGNSRANVCELFKQNPDFEKIFVRVITSDEYAPHFAKIINYGGELYRRGKWKRSASYLENFYAIWEADPSFSMPDGQTFGFKPPLSFKEWVEKVYAPFMAPNKIPILGEAGVLIDDEAVKKDPIPLVKSLIEKKRIIFAGPRGSEASNEVSPDWPKIVEIVRKTL